MPRVSHERRAFFYPSKIPGYPKYKGVDAPPGPLLSRVTLPGPVGILGLLCYSVYSDRLGALLMAQSRSGFFHHAKPPKLSLSRVDGCDRHCQGVQ